MQVPFIPAGVEYLQENTCPPPSPSTPPSSAQPLGVASFHASADRLLGVLKCAASPQPYPDIQTSDSPSGLTRTTSPTALHHPPLHSTTTTPSQFHYPIHSLAAARFAMMETDPPRPAPSRYKTVRRKPAVPVVATPVPAMQGPPQPPLVQPPPTTPLIDLAMQSKLLEDANADPPQLQRQQSRFRKLLRLNTKDHPPAPLALPHTAPPSVPSSRPHTESHRRQVVSPEGSRVQSDQSDDDLEKQRAREDAIAALEGKRRPSKHRKPVEDTVSESRHQQCCD
jgi:hypothetical protein